MSIHSTIIILARVFLSERSRIILIFFLLFLLISRHCQFFLHFYHIRHQLLGLRAKLDIFIHVILKHLEVNAVFLVESIDHVFGQLGEVVGEIQLILSGVFPPERDDVLEIPLAEYEVCVPVYSFILSIRLYKASPQAISPRKSLHFDNYIKIEMTGWAEQENWLPVFVVLVDRSLHEILHELHEGRFLPHEQRILGKLFLIFWSVFLHDVGPVHCIVVT